MLKQMRAGAKSKIVNLILFGPLLLAMGALAMVGGQSTIREAIKGDTVVTIAGKNISLTTFDRLVQNAIHNNQMKQSDAYARGLPRQLLTEEVDTRILTMAANDIGLAVDDATAAKRIKEMLAPYVAKGLTAKEALERILYANNASEATFVATVKDEIANETLQKTIASGVTPPAQLVNDILKFGNEYRRGSYFRLTAASAGGLKPPSDAELKEYYASVRQDYALPEYRTLSVLLINKDSLGDSVKVSDDKLHQYYEDNIAEFSTPESRTFSQVVANDEASAQQIFATASAGKNLEAAAKDKGSFIKSGTYTKDKVASELAQAVFSGKAGDFLPPVKSPLGWHVIHVEKITPGTSKSFGEVKAAIEKEMTQDTVSDALYKFANKIDDDIASGKSVSDVARENHLSETTLEKIDAHGVGASGQKPDTKLPVYDKLVKDGFALPKGSASQLIETPDNAFAIVGVKEIYPSEQLSFEKVHDKILSRWMTDHQSKALGEKAEKLLAEMKAGKSIESVAAETGASVQSTGLIKRGASSAAAKLDSNLVGALFTLENAGAATKVEDSNVVTILSLAERKIQPAGDGAEKEAANTRDILIRSLQQDLLEQYRLSLIAKYDVTINAKLMADKYAPKNAENQGPGGSESDDGQ